MIAYLTLNTGDLTRGVAGMPALVCIIFSNHYSLHVYTFCVSRSPDNLKGKLGNLV